MLTFYSLTPAKMERYLPYMEEWYFQRKEEMSEVGWTNGLYIGRAVGGCISKKSHYPDLPLEIYKRPEPEEDSIQEESQMCFDAQRFLAFATVYNKANEKRFEGDDDDADDAGDESPDALLDGDPSGNVDDIDIDTETPSDNTHESH